MQRLWLLTAIGMFLGAGTLSAQEPANAKGTYEREGNFGVGLQLTSPTYGLSAMADLSDRFSVQGVLGTGGYGAALTGRGLYRLQPQELFVPYGYGEIGTWTGTYSGINNAFIWGLGGGLETDPRRLLEGLEDFPPIYAALEVGLNFISWGSGYNWTRFQGGLALHYRF